MNISFFRRMPPPNVEKQEEIPGIDDLPPDILEEDLQAYRSHLSQLPNPADHQLGGLKKGLSMLAAGLAGFGQNSATAGASLGMGLIEAPYRRALENYTRKSKALGEVAELEQDRNRENRLKWTTNATIAEKRQARKDKAAADEAKRLQKENDDNQIVNTSDGRVMIANKNKGTMKQMTEEGSGQGMMSAAPAKMQQASMALDETLTMAKQLQKVADKFKGSWEIGPISGGFMRQASRYVPGMSSEDRAELYRLIDTLANNNLYEKSGAQINNKEFERLRRTLMDPNTNETTFFDDLQGTLDSLQRTADRFKTRGVWSEDASADNPNITGNPANPATPGTAAVSPTVPGTIEKKERRYQLRIER